MTLIAIVGTGRNGSTMLARLLDGMPGVYVHPVEANFLSAMDNLARLPIVLDKVRKNAVTYKLRRLETPVAARRLLRYYRAQLREIEGELLAEMDGPPMPGPPPEAALSGRRAWTPREFVPAFLAASAAWLGQPARCFAFKTIETPYIADYERLFPQMRFIHLLRDPVEVWSSQKRSSVANKSRPPWYIGMDSLRAMIECRWLPHAAALATRRNDARHVILRYEDLILDPARAIGAIAAWLGLPPPAEPTVQTVLGGRHPRSMTRYPSQRGVETPREVASDLRQRFRYDEVVTPRERDLIVFRTQPLARLFGYLADEPQRQPKQLFKEWLAKDEWDFRHTAGAKSWLYSLYCFIARRIYILRLCLHEAAVPEKQ